MESIGEKLKNARIEKGLSLADAYESTRITMQNLAALEEDRFDAFANRVYARAFLRDYANYLDVDSTELLQQYETLWNMEAQAAAVPPKKSRSRAAAFVVILLLLIGTGGATYYYLTSMQPVPKTVSSKSETKAKPVEQAKSAKPAKPDTKVAETQPTTVDAGSAGNKDTPEEQKEPKDTGLLPAAPPGMVQVVFKAVEGASWVDVKRDGKREVITTLQQGQSYSVAPAKSIHIRAGNSGNLHAIVNGKDLGPIGPKGQPKNAEYKAENFQQ